MKIKAWAIIDIKNRRSRFCYASTRGTIRQKIGYGAIFLKKPPKNIIPEKRLNPTNNNISAKK